MAKTPEEIKELLATELFQKGIAKKYIILNENNTSIYYNSKNQAKRRLANPEEFVQATTFLKLIFEYNYNPKNIAINESVQIGSTTKEADIMVYDDDNKRILIVVECKDENINERQFLIAVDQAYSYAHAKAAKYVWITSGVKDEYYEIISSTPVERIYIANIPAKNKDVQRYKYTKGVNEPEKGTQAELINKFKSAHDALWGGGALAPTTAFDELDKLIFCKIWDEKWKENDPMTKEKPFDFQIILYSEDRKDRFNTKAKVELEKRIKALYEKGREKDSEVFKDDIKLDKNKIFTVVQYLQDINISKTDLDAKGAAFQTFMGEFFRGDFGQFFTPTPIVQFIVDSIPLKQGDKVLDTSCGSGGFLLHALKHIRDEADKIFSDEIGSTVWYKYWHDFAEKNLYGIEINEQISRVAKMNMIIHDDGHTNVITNNGLKGNRDIEIENRNRNFQDGTFSLIMTNPPFGSVIRINEIDYYKDYELFEKNLGYRELKERIIDDDNKNKWRISQSTEVLFLERCYNYLKDGGYLAIVIPDGILTNATSQYVRDWLVDKFRIIAVASLPQFTFAHVRAGVKSSVLFLKKNPSEQVALFEEILMSIKHEVRKMKTLDKGQKGDKIIELYKQQIFKIIDDYDVKMIDIQNIGYDPAGKPVVGSELKMASKKISEFISNKGL
ncbi:restriction endonuclease subunit M [Dysgonomonas sp. Marseille-P4677]|uniref:restriction endonuclease subunit M n=1 Tax=Dysgonomonas sp. Marseille-P4677 TaxID=2364790 RepID=UPI001913F207|nr:N-6 DNA methylase [Dysgonomonas sp. Marseille-P4677]MBK5722007.1 restriction endonuclease subunit M [Dysgonomonas sp. Marseille-P4677]